MKARTRPSGERAGEVAESVKSVIWTHWEAETATGLERK